METTTQIGWISFDTDREFHDNGWECAAWYQDVLVKAGKYPLFIYGLTVDDDGHVRGSSPEMARANLPGTVVRDDFGARFCGNPIGGYDGKQNAGKETSYHWEIYLFSLARYILEKPVWDDGTRLELLPEYEARNYQVTAYDGEILHLTGIFRKGE